MSEQQTSKTNVPGPKQPPRLHGEGCICGDYVRHECPVKDRKQRPTVEPASVAVNEPVFYRCETCKEIMLDAHLVGTDSHERIEETSQGQPYQVTCGPVRPSVLSAGEYINRFLPANWLKDSSLETWFPIAAEELKRLKDSRATVPPSDDYAFAGPLPDAEDILDGLAPRIDLTEHQVKHLLDFIDASPAALSLCEYTHVRKCKDSGEEMPAGLYVWYTEYPEEGQLLLKAYPPEVEEVARATATKNSVETEPEGRGVRDNPPPHALSSSEGADTHSRLSEPGAANVAKPHDDPTAHRVADLRAQSQLPDEPLSVYDRNRLRALVDDVWNAATESEQVPHTAWADEIIDKWAKEGVSVPSEPPPIGRLLGEFWTVLSKEGELRNSNPPIPGLPFSPHLFSEKRPHCDSNAVGHAYQVVRVEVRLAPEKDAEGAIVEGKSS